MTAGQGDVLLILQRRQGFLPTPDRKGLDSEGKQHVAQGLPHGRARFDDQT